jgi:hypothetical protein
MVLIWVAFSLKGMVLADQSSFNKFSYVGVVATLIALLVAVFEVLHSIRVSKGIRDEARRLFSQAQEVIGASFVSECISALDEANSYISSERYTLSLRCFQDFRKTYAKISEPKSSSEEISKVIDEVELGLYKATHTTAVSPLTKKTKTGMQKKILNIKTYLEELNAVKGSDYVSA